jgi:uncharacterized protein YbaA (DUF1428 family)
MAYVDGFAAPVRTADKDAYIAYARWAWAMFRKHGALRMVECWGDDVPDGVVTSFPMAVKLEEGETAVFSWIEWPDRATRDACHAAMATDPDMAALGEMPFDGKRMIYGGFVPVVDVT